MASDLPTIRVSGHKEAVTYLRSLDRKLANNKPGFKKIRVRYSEMVKEVFKAEGGPYGTNKWPGLSPMRQAIRASSRPSWKTKPILRWTNVLRDVASATGPMVKTDTGRTVFKAKGVWDQESHPMQENPTTMAYMLQETKDYMAAGLAGPKTIHEFGGTVPGYRGKPYNLPKRQFWPWSAQTSRELVNVWSMYLDDIVK